MCDNARCVTSAFSAKPIPRGFMCNSTVTGLVLELCLVTVFSLSSLRRFRRHGQEAGVSAMARDVAADTRSSPRGARGAPACASAVGALPAACRSSLLLATAESLGGHRRCSAAETQKVSTVTLATRKGHGNLRRGCVPPLVDHAVWVSTSFGCTVTSFNFLRPLTWADKICAVWISATLFDT